jgi:hypothetical protein
MSIGVKTQLQQATALVHRQPAWDGLSLSNTNQCSVSLASCQSRYAALRSHCSDAEALPSEAINVRPAALNQRRLPVESP